MKRLVTAFIAFVMIFGLCHSSSVTVAAETVRTLDPRIEERVAFGDSLLEQGETVDGLQDALNAYQDAWELDKENVAAILRIADVYIRMNDIDKATTWLHENAYIHPAIQAKLGELESGLIKDINGNTRQRIRYHEDGSLFWTLVYQHDEQGRISGVVLYDGNGNELDHAENVYNEHGDQIKFFTLVYELDKSCRLLKTEVSYTYDENDNILAMDDMDGKVHREFSYDENDNKIKMVVYSGSVVDTTEYEYDEENHLVKENFYRSGELYIARTYEYNELGQQIVYDSHDYNPNTTLAPRHERRITQYDGDKIGRTDYYYDEVFSEYMLAQYDDFGKILFYQRFDKDGNLLETRPR